MKLNTLLHGLLRCNLKDVSVETNSRGWLVLVGLETACNAYTRTRNFSIYRRATPPDLQLTKTRIFDEVSFDNSGLIRNRGCDFERKPWITVLTFIGVNEILDDYNTNGTFNRVQFIKCCQYVFTPHRRVDCINLLVCISAQTNAPSTFQRVKNNDLWGLTWNTCLVYLDSMQPILQVACLLERFSVAGLTLKLKKCYFAIEEMEYLGHELSSEGVRPFDRLMTAAREFPTPTNAKEIKRFFHLAGYYRRFVKGFGAMMAPLMKMLRKNVMFPLLLYSNFNLPFRLVTAASVTTSDYYGPCRIEVVDVIDQLEWQTTQMEFVIEYRPGKINVVSDALSRVPAVILTATGKVAAATSTAVGEH
ncbi:Gag/polymerase/env Polyprotein [Phytophthora megakarya]|uniref:Gag/polymerase/env Polyprotein n=1 Tax=Phytophthora megakarya TaxID=4795 RepID=A0A225W3G3_9STRA|nr:Gag/polymerase/env Polyprotein [Phytophthora megakarya]